MNKDWWRKEKKVIGPFILHAPKHVVWRSHKETVDATVVQVDVNVNIVVLWINILNG
jgi:hypothetical protein